MKDTLNQDLLNSVDATIQAYQELKERLLEAQAEVENENL